MAQPILPEGVNEIGVAAGIAFLMCWIGGVISGIGLWNLQKASSQRISLWKEPARPHFLRFLLFAAAGLLCGGVAFLFGGWPTGYE